MDASQRRRVSAYWYASGMLRRLIGWRVPQHMEDCRRDWARLVIGYGC